MARSTSVMEKLEDDLAVAKMCLKRLQEEDKDYPVQTAFAEQIADTRIALSALYARIEAD